MRRQDAELQGNAHGGSPIVCVLVRRLFLHRAEHLTTRGLRTTVLENATTHDAARPQNKAQAAQVGGQRL